MYGEADRRRRRAQHRQTWLEMTFDVVPHDPSFAVSQLWATGGTSTKVACEILDTDPAGLLRLVERLGIAVRRDS